MKNLLLSKINLKSAAIILGAVTIVFAMAPRVIDSAHADQSCSPTFSTPIFNPYTISDNGGNCMDLPFMRAEIVRNGQAVGTWQADVDNNQINAQPGDQVEFVLYVHNGAIQNGNPSVTTATGEAVSASVGSENATTHQVTAQVTASNTSNSLNGWMFINTPSNTQLQVTPGGQVWYAKTGDSDPSVQPTEVGPLNFVNTTASLPDQQACFGYIREIYFTVNVVAQQSAPSPVICSPATQTVNANQAVAVTATGGNGNYTFSSSDGTSGQQSGNSFAIQYPTGGNRTITVNDNSGTNPSGTCTVQVNQAPPTGSATLNVSLNGQVQNQCLYDGTVTWTSSNLNNVQIFVVNTATGQSSLFAATPNGSEDAPWLTPGTTVHFYLTADGGYQKDAYVTVPALNCNTTPPPPTGSATLNVSLNAQVPNQCLYDGTVTWTSSNLNDVQVFVVNTATNQPTLFAATPNGSEDAPWLTPGKTVHFYLTADGGYQKDAYVTVPSVSCNQTSPLTCSATTNTTINPGGSVSFQANGGSSPYTFNANGATNASASSNTETATYNNSGTYQVSVRDSANNQVSCGTVNVNTVSNPLTCTPATQTINSGGTAAFTANGGTGSDTWQYSGGTALSSTSGTTFAASYTNSGSTNSNQTVTVSDSAGHQATCGVTIQPQAQPTLTNNASCLSISAPSTVTPGQVFSATVNMQNSGTQPWISTGTNYYRLGTQDPQDNLIWGIGRVSLPFSPVNAGQQASFNFSATAPTTPGVYNFDWEMVQEQVQWFGGVCKQQITVTAPVSNPLTCTPATQTINSGGTAAFTANGGTGSDTWQAPGATPLSSTSGSTFAASYINNSSANSNQNVTVTDSSGHQATCGVTVQPQPQQTLTNNATCVSINAPSTLTPGQTFSATVTMQNSGTAPWTSGGNNPYRLGSQDPQDNGTWGVGRVNLPFSPVNPGQQVPFNFTATAPTTPGVYNFDWEMVQEQIQWFNSVCHQSITVSQTPVPLTCNATTNTTINPGGYVSFLANGGSSPYTFNANGASNSASNGPSSETATYNNSGTYQVTVHDSAGNQVSCGTVVVNQPISNPLTCSATTNTTINPGGSVSFQANGGSSPYTFNANGATNASASSNTETATYNNSGTYQVSVRDSANNQVSCGTVNVNQPVCQSDSNAALNASQPQKNGSTYSVNLTWSTTGNNQVKITEISGSSSETLVTTGNPSGSFTVTNLQPGTNYIFKLYDNSCGGLLTSTSVNTPANPGQLTCSASSSTISSGQAANFTANGGSAPYNWSGDGSPTTGSGSSFNPSYNNSTQSAITHTVTVQSNDGQTASCSVIVSGTPVQNGTISLTKLVENVTANGSFSHSATAKQGDTLEYQITVSDNSSVTLNNVLVQDSFDGSSLNYIDGSLEVNGQPHATGLTSSGLSFTSLSQGSPIVITYQATVNINSGSVVNVATATAQNATNTAQDQATVVVSQILAGLSCTATPSSITPGGTTTFAATGGNGNYSWTANGGSVTSSSQQSFQSQFNNSGSYTATVTSAGSQTSCNVVVNPQVCQSDSNAALNASQPQKNGSTYSVNLTWSTTGNNQVKITEISGSSSETLVTTGNPSGSFTVTNLQPGTNYIFKLYDNSCGGLLTSTSVNTPANPGQLTCSASSSTISSGQAANFTANGGSAPYNWSGDGSPTTGSGSSFNPSYNNSTQSAITHTVTVQSNDGQTASCSVIVSGTPVQNGTISLTKLVENVTANGSFSHSATAKQGDTLEYQITVSDNSSVTLNNVLVQDSFDGSSLNYIDGSLEVNGQPHATGLTSSGLSFTSLSQGSPIVITYQATVNINSGSVVNVATATAQNATNTAQDQASVAVNFVQSGQPTLAITKQVEDLTQSTGFNTTISAKQGDSVEYQVVVQNIGQTPATAVFVNDSNPSGVQPLSNITATVNFTGGIPQGISLGSLQPNASVTVTYQGTVNVSSGSIVNQATVSASNATSQIARATINVGTQQTNGTTNNNCVNYSCNTNTTNTNTTNTTNTNNSVNNSNNNNNNTTNNNTNNSVNNSNNTSTSTTDNSVNNSNNTTSSISGSYNNTTTTYNSYTNTYYINSSGTVVPANQFSQITITKSVRLNNYGTFSNSVSASTGQTVQFEIAVTNSASQTANNVQVSDPMPSGLTLVSGSVQVNGSMVSDSNLYNGMYLGNLTSGQSERIDFSATVNSASQNSIQNTATATSDNAGSVQASAWVFVSTPVYPVYPVNPIYPNPPVQNGSVNLTYTKQAFNNTKNTDATAVAASREDFITYTLTVQNSGNSAASNFVITDDLSQVLPYADITDNGGGTVSGNVISFPGITVPAGGSVTRSFEVRVKYALSTNLSYVMTNTYGNTVTIRINTPQVLGAFVAPKTGADTNGFVFSGLMTAAAALVQKRKNLLKLIFN